MLLIWMLLFGAQVVHIVMNVFEHVIIRWNEAYPPEMIKVRPSIFILSFGNGEEW